MQSFWSELKRRHVIKVAVAYAVLAWLVVQVAATMLPIFEAPRWVLQTLTLVLVLGFPLAVGLAWAFEVTPEGARRDRSIRSNAGADRAPDQTTTAGAATAEAPTAPNKSAPKNSIAVLPFANISPREEDAYFAIGLHEEILNHLAKVQALSVISRTSVLRFKDSDVPVPEIAAKLKVGTVLEGSVRYSGDRIRITVQLIDAVTDQHLWSETYDREFVDIFAIESDVAVKVAEAMQAAFSPAERRSIERAATSSPEAYALYLQAWTVYAGRQDNPRVDALLDRAIALDPDFALALGFKAYREAERLTSTMVGSPVSEAERAHQQQMATEYAKRALAVDAKVPFANAALASILFYSWHWTQATEAYERALAVAPHDFFARGYFGWLMAMRGKAKEAVELQRKSLELNPGDWTGHGFLGFSHGYAKNFTAAISEFHRALELAPIPLARLWLGYMEIARGDAAAGRESLAEAERMMADAKPLVVYPELTYAYSRAGARGDVARLHSEIQSLGVDTKSAFGCGGQAMLHLALGEYDEALADLDELARKAAAHQIDSGFISAQNLKLNVMEDPVLREPRFREALARVTGD